MPIMLHPGPTQIDVEAMVTQILNVRLQKLSMQYDTKVAELNAQQQELNAFATALGEREAVALAHEEQFKVQEAELVQARNRAS